MRERQQSTSTKTIPIVMRLSVDHITLATGKTVTVKLSKNGGTSVTASGAVSEIDSANLPGQYSVAGNATDTNTLGPMTVYATATGCDPFIAEYNIVSYDPYGTNLGITNVTSDVAKWNGTAVATPATAGVPDVNAKAINNVATTSVTAVSANVGTTQPINFTGTGASALTKSDLIDIASAAVNTALAQLGVNVVSYASGQAPLQSTVAGRTLDVSATGEAGVDWANIGLPTTAVDLSGTTIKNVDNAIANVTLVGTTTNVTNAPTNGDFTTTMKTSLNAATPASVTTVTGNVNGNVTGSVGSVLGNVTLAASQPNYAPLKQSDLISDSGTAQSGTTTNIRLRAGAPSTDIKGQTVFIQSGTGALQSSSISAYNTTTKDATTIWGTAPANDSVYVVLASQGGSSSGGSGDTSSFSGAAKTQVDAIEAKTNQITNSTAVNVVSPVSASQNITVIRGDDYKNADGRALSFAVTNCPSLTGGSVALNVSVPGGTVHTYAGVITSATAFYVELSSTDTSSFNPGSYAYDIQVTLVTSGDIVTPIMGQFVVTADVR